MEHRNSTMITIGSAFRGEDRMLGVFAHEFFHCWNVKRIRPRTLEPFNFEKSDMSYELWFAEGFTQYYGNLLPVRAGIGKDTDFVKRTVAQLIDTKTNTPGARRYSPVEASEMAVFTDAGVSVDVTNFQNIFTSYYPYGAAIALALDLELREKYSKTLDDLMQAAWKKFGKPEAPYNVPGLQEVLAAVTGDKKFAQEFFTNYIYGHEPIDYEPLLAPAGFRIRKTDPSKAWIGTPRMSEREGLLIMQNTLRGSPLYDAGLDVDDKIISIDNQDIRTLSDLAAALDRLHPGNLVNIRYLHRNEDRTARITPQENPGFLVESFETAGLPVTPAITKFRQSWLGPR
jgi:predicted metalloprotease with PDZ domain